MKPSEWLISKGWVRCRAGFITIWLDPVTLRWYKYHLAVKTQKLRDAK